MSQKYTPEEAAKILKKMKKETGKTLGEILSDPANAPLAVGLDSETAQQPPRGTGARITVHKPPRARLL